MNFIINFRKKKIMKTKADRMKKIIFSKLWEDDTYCKVGSVHFQDKSFGKVYMNQEWGNHEKKIQRLKGIINFNSQEKGWSFLVDRIRRADIEK